MSKKTDALLEHIRLGNSLTGSEKLNLIIGLSIPSILAQITSVLMFFIDASMVGSLGAEASASIGLVEPAGWLFGSLGGAVALGFSVQVAHFIGANDFQRARQVMKHGYVVCLLFSFVIMAISGVIAPWLPGWLGGRSRHSTRRHPLFSHLCLRRALLLFGVALQCTAQIERRHESAGHCAFAQLRP